MLPHRTRLPIVATAAIAGSETVVEGPPAPGTRRSLPLRTGIAAGFPDRAMTWRVVRRDREREALAASWRSSNPSAAVQREALAAAQAWYASDGAILDDSLVFVVSKRGEPSVIFPCYRRGREIRLAGDQAGGIQDVVAAAEVPDAEIQEALRLLFAWVRRRCGGCEVVFERLSPEGRLLPLLEAMDPVREHWYRHRRSSASRRAVPPAEAAGQGDPLASWVSITLLPRTVAAFPRFLGKILDRCWRSGGRGAGAPGWVAAFDTRRPGDVDSVSSGREG